MSLYIGNSKSSANLIAGKADTRDYRYVFTKKGYISTVTPANPEENDFWINSGSMPTTFPVVSTKIYKNGSWKNGNSYSPLMYDLWTYYSSGTGYLNYYRDTNRNAWILLDNNENYLKLSGGNMTGNINFLNGHTQGIYWREGRFGDKFEISPSFSGTNDSNLLRIRGAVGDLGTNPDLYDILTISGKSGNLWAKGTISDGSGICPHSTDSSVKNIRAMSSSSFDSNKGSIPNNTLVAVY